jgi:hypothetical protein
MTPNMKKAEERVEMRASQSMPIALLGVISICLLSFPGCTAGEAAVTTTRPDLIDVSQMTLLGEFDRAPVQFPHDLHTAVMAEREEDCTLCHVVEDKGYLSTTYKPLVDATEQQTMDLYHENCISCHEEIASEGSKSGPVACGDCHRRHPIYLSSRQPFGFDKSLHYRHVKANNEKCDGCHHLFDETKKELIYVEGREDSCRDCHREKTEGNRSSFSEAAHTACIGCHRNPPPQIQTESRGPQECAGCHDRQHQLDIKVVESPPRLKRNQPDFALLSTSEADRESSKLRTVPFSHVNHEERASNCRGCHHETFEACSECHTLSGAVEGDGVKFYRAMHEMVSEFSCIGCHETKKTAAECAGCHDRMPQRKLSEDVCVTCHAGPLPPNLETERSIYTSFDDFRPKPSEIELTFATADIPEEVKIGILSEKFEAAVMPHRRIVDKLREYIDQSSMATQFHGREDIVCQGCHHETPVGVKPPLCESCHEKEIVGSNLLTPRLRGAYHRQCLGCHQSMNLEKPSDCSGCHAEKSETVETVASIVVR